MDRIRVRPLPPDADLAGLRRYRPNGVADTLPGYWLAPALFGIGADGAPALAAPESIDMAIGLHLCRLRRPLGPREIRFLRAGIGAVSYTI